MAFNLYEHVWNCGAVEGLEKLVLMRLSDHAKPDGSSVRPSVARVAAHCGVSVRTARQQIGTLQAKGILILVREEDAAKMAPREYKIDVKKLTALRSPQLGKQDAKLNARGKKTLRPQTTEKTLAPLATPGTVCLGSADTPRQDLPGDPGTVCLGPPAGYAGAPGTVCRENLPIQSTKITSQDNQSEEGSLRSPSARETENPRKGGLIEPASPSHAGKIEAAEPSQVALRKAEPKAGAGTAKAAPAGKIVMPDQGELIPAPPKPEHASDASLPAELIEPFGEFYDKAFPFPRDRGAARDAFQWAVNFAKAKPAELIEASRHYAAERAQDRRDQPTVKQYTTKPAKWLRAESWKNAPASAPEAELSRIHGATRNSRVVAYETEMFGAIGASIKTKTDTTGF